MKISIFREGISKENREMTALDPVSVQLNDRSIPDILNSTRAIADQFAYYDIANNIDGDWQPFFEPAITSLPDSYLDYLLDLPDERYDTITTRNITPHIALFLTFLALVQKLKTTVNAIPARHFDFFINTILQFKPKDGIADKAIVLLELPGNAVSFKIDQGSLFLGGKGFDQQDIIYKSEREIIVNQAKITDWRSSFRNTGDFSKIYITAGADALKAEADKVIPDDKGWMAFGDGRLKDAELKTVPAPTGWAISSPALYMQEGERSVFIDIFFDWTNTTTPLPALDTPIAIDAYVTSEKGWLKADVLLSQYRASTQSIIANIQVPASYPPIVPGANLPENISAKWPILKMVVRPDINTNFYDILQYVAVKKIDLTVTVNGIKNVVLQTSTGIADPAHSFLPFGSNPAWGSKMYVGLNEIRYKNVRYINITYKWKKAPKNFGVYYQEYFSNGGVRPLPAQIPIDNSSYKGSLAFLKDGKYGNPSFIDLFPVNPLTDEKKIEDFTFIPASEEERNNGITDLAPINNFPTGGYWMLSFDTLVNNSVFTGPLAFGQDEYPRVLSEIAIGKATGNATYSNVNLPNAPYIPEIDYLFVSYIAFESFDAFSGDGENLFFHVSPFGIYSPDSANNQIIPLHQPEGFLYMGVEQLTPPQNLTILFQVQEKGSDHEINPDYFSWSYLAGNKWIDLNKQQVVIDQTFGLKTSGIVELSIPATASIDHTVMPAGKHWVRLGVVKDVANVNPVTDLQTQAVRLVYFGDLANKPGILPADSIKMLVGNNGQIKSITQPYQTYGGQDSESEAALRLRTYERLHHRDRMVSYWDYERLVLNAFPEIYKTKILQCTDEDQKNAAGHVTIIAIPDQRGNNIVQPKCSQLLLDRIKAFMEEKSPPGVTLHAVNPTYEAVYFDFYVAFLPGLDTGYYKQQLNKELKAFISPWAFDNKEGIYFDAVFYKTDIIRFIETRAYVDYVSTFEMYSSGGEAAVYGIGDMYITASGDLEKLDDFIVGETIKPAIDDMVIEDNFIVGMPVDVAVASSPSGILVTADVHRIRIIEPGTLGVIGISGIGIGSMAIEIDFIIT
ncbi:MAG: baseplate J/gp47 family protein [Bacteroidota bacterium]|nr:baseplate J/gp47 family protein [Bacteroidota bacterium]